MLQQRQSSDPLQQLSELIERISPLPWVKTVSAHAHGDPANGPCYAATVNVGGDAGYTLVDVDDVDATVDADTDLIALSPSVIKAAVDLARCVRWYSESPNRGAHAAMDGALDAFTGAVAAALPVST